MHQMSLSEIYLLYVTFVLIRLEAGAVQQAATTHSHGSRVHAV